MVPLQLNNKYVFRDEVVVKHDILMLGLTDEITVTKRFRNMLHLGRFVVGAVISVM